MSHDTPCPGVNGARAAATGLAFGESEPSEPELSVKADRPFLYVIRHRDGGLALFAGQVTDPVP